jgi:hypothetical protein
MGAAISATAIATEIMILLSIEVRIAQVRLPVEEKRSEVFRTYSPCFSQGVTGNFHFLRAFFRWQFLQAICNNGDYNSLLNPSENSYER